MLMARLNDPPVPPPESIDALKRRFIRQNREIARVNSTQSQRIRNLETEISRLLAENIALREQAIGAAVEAERWRAASRVGKDVLDLQLRLKAKLGEVNLLVEELGGLPDRAARRSSVRRRKSGYVQDLAASPNDRDWRNRQTATSGDGQDGKLPAILEDKYYPRRTLETEELRILTALVNVDGEDTESPELGPPPVAHFEVADPIIFDSARSPKRVSGGIVSNDDEIVSLPKNLEARRKRRTSSLLHDMAALHEPVDDVVDDAENQSAPSAKSYTKRKFETSEMEVETSAPLQNDGFEYSRRITAVSNRSKSTRFAPRPVNRAQEQQVANQPASPSRQEESRRILAPKSTNSPTKKVTVHATGKNDVPQGEQQSLVKSNIRRTSRIGRIEIPKAVENVPDTYAPKTPAPPSEDIISPPSSAMDTAPKHKSIEAAITNSVEDVLNGSIGRGSRRAKSAVSYAEPNLRDKMRRPDKKLVGAVEGLNKANGTTDKESGRESTRDRSTDPTNTSSAKPTTVKSESKFYDDNQWKNLPETAPVDETASPLKDKERPTTKPIEFRKKRTYSESEGTRTKQPPTSNHEDNHNLDKAVARLSIYDPPKSSPLSSSAITVQSIEPKSTRPTSSVSSTITSTSTHPPRPSSAARTRRSSIQPAQDPIQTKRPTTREISGKENISHASTKLKRASSVQAINLGLSKDGNISVSTTEVRENALGRRRSTML